MRHTVRVYTSRRRRRNPRKKSRGSCVRTWTGKHKRWHKVTGHKRRTNPFRRRRRSRKNPYRVMHRVTRTNPMYRRRRRNPAMGLPRVGKVLNAKTILRFVSMGAGFLVGNQVNRFLSTGAFFFYVPAASPGWTATIAPARPFFGFAQILLGGMFAMKSRSPVMQDLATGIAVAGGVDLVGQVVNLISPATAQGMDVSPGAPVVLGGNENPMMEESRHMGMDMPGYSSLMGMDVNDLYSGGI